MNSKNDLISIVLLSLLLYSALSLASAGRELSRAEEATAALEREAAMLQAENEYFQTQLQKELGDEDIAQLARQRLGLVLPGEKIFYFTTDREE